MDHNEIVEACKNIGYDLSCGACAELFYTGICIDYHDDTCKTQLGVYKVPFLPPVSTYPCGHWMCKVQGESLCLWDTKKL